MAKSDTLVQYRKKRDFSRTPEPKGVPVAKEGHRYLIQKHAATRLHYDFRLELDGVLKSWAVTRGPSLNPRERRLAVEVEDHPVAYGSFEGIIPQGEYGGGTVMLWDEGNWEPIGDPHQGLKNGKLEFRLHGKRLQGEWTLVRMKDREKDKGRHNWLLIKRSDEAAQKSDADSILTKNATSVTTGRTMEAIAAAEDRVWQSKKKSAKSQLPEFSPPQLATLADAMPQGEQWVHEVKFDGYRAVATLENGDVHLYTRTGLDWTQKFPTLAKQLAKLPAKTAILDGEIVAVNKKGISSFTALQKALSEGQDKDLQYYVFDLLYLNGDDLKPQTLFERKKQLASLLKKAKALSKQVFYSEHFASRGDEMLKRCCSLHLEGVISKRSDAPYRSGRGTSWLKAKCHRRQEFVIGGFTLPTHASRGVGALLIGYRENNDFIYAGKVGTGFDNQTSLSLRAKLNAAQQKTMPFKTVTPAGKRGAKWVKPQLVCEVEFTEWTPDGHLRHPSFQGLREDKPAETIERDVPVILQSNQKTTARDNSLVGGISISHPDRIIYPGSEITKKQLAEYMVSVADDVLPHVKNRPLSMLRCPGGIGETCFFQRHIAKGQSSDVHDTGITVKGRNENYLMIKDVKGLIALVQWGVIELHPWGCLADKPNRPDRIIFDLDPDSSVPWESVMEGAKEIRQRMQEFGLVSFVKTTGGKGLHVVIPIERGYEWKPIKAFAHSIADSMQHDNPKRYISKSSKQARTGKIFVDYLRNDLTATAIAPYSPRAREGAPVSMPIDWEELKRSFNSQAFTVNTVPEILRKRKNDPWAELFSTRQKIASRYLNALKITL